MSDRPSVCEKIEVDLLASATGETTPDVVRRVHAHLDRCGSCRDEFEHYQAIDRAVTALRTTPLPAGSVGVAREKLESRLADLRSRLVLYRIFPSPFGHVLIARSELGVVLIEYLREATTLRASRLSRMEGVEAMEDGDEVEALYHDFREYLAGRRPRLPWPLDLRLARSEFQRTVLEATATIPFGAVVSYKGLARDVGRPEAVRAVAQALRWNPLPVVIPCHRVIGASGLLTGYAGGETSRKQRLLSVEGIPLVRAPHDFRVARDVMYVRMPGDAEYCLPTCPSVEALRTNTPMFFGSRERAEAAGFAPCTTCRPDLHPIHR